MAMTVGELTAYLGLDDSRFKRGLNENEGRFRKFGSRVGSIGAAVGKVAFVGAAAGVTALGGAMSFGAVKGIQYNASIEQTTIAMTTMLGSAKEAEALIGEISKLAAATPFEFPELADATRKLTAYGYAAGEIPGFLTRIGDISSAMGINISELTDIIGKMKVSGTLYLQDIYQLQGRGIPIMQELAKVTGTNVLGVKEMISAGKIGYPQVEKALENLTSKGSMFGGMMGKQSKSFNGQLSTLKDNFTQLFGKAFMPLFTWLTKKGIPALNEAMPSIEKGINGLMGIVGPLLDSISGWFKENGPGIIDSVKKIAGIWLSALAPALQQILPLFRDIGDTVAAVAGFIKDKWSAVWSAIGPIVKLAAKAVGSALDLLVHAVRAILAVIRGDWSAAFEHFNGVSDATWKLITSGAKLFGKAFMLVLEGVWKLLKGGVKLAFNGIKSLIGGAWDWIVGKTSRAWNAVLRTVGGFVNKIIGVINVLPGVDINKVTWGSPSSTGYSSRKTHGSVARGDPSGGWDAMLDNGPKGDVSDVLGGVIDGLPKPPRLPAPFNRMLPTIVKWVWGKVKGLLGAVSGLGGSGYGWATTLAKRFGLAVTSTYRPGAITAAGYPSDHGIYGRAADFAGSLSGMGSLWRYIKGTARSWKQAIYKHEIVNYGKLGYYAPSDHFDHVHVARSYSPPGRSRSAGDDSRPFDSLGVDEKDYMTGASGGEVHIHVNLPGGTTLVGEAENVGRILAPFIMREIQKRDAFQGRGR